MVCTFVWNTQNLISSQMSTEELEERLNSDLKNSYIKIGGLSVKRVKTTKCFGMVIDDKLEWEGYGQELTKRIFKICRCLTHSYIDRLSFLCRCLTHSYIDRLSFLFFTPFLSCVFVYLSRIMLCNAIYISLFTLCFA